METGIPAEERLFSSHCCDIAYLIQSVLFPFPVQIFIAMSEPGLLDFKQLERELAVAVAADQKYKRENDAKFRAIHQKVSSYEEFRDIVLASNLKPLERKDKIGMERKQPWNQVSAAIGSSREATCTIIQESTPEPTNAFEFIREWRRLGVEKRYDFLLQLKSEKISQLFHTEVSSGLLGEFLTVLEKDIQSTHHKEVLKILHSLANTQRFDLNLIFLSGAEKESCKKLFMKLHTFKEMSEDVDDEFRKENILTNLMVLYKISESNN
ncbi:dynein axonemal assembly factor 19 [Pelodytes ibericus]